MSGSAASHVFVSYSRADEDFVNRLIAGLRAGGVNIWIDTQGLKAGTRNWEQALRETIRTARALVLVASPSSRQSNYVQDELSIAEMYHCPVYPIWADGNQWIDCIPMGLGKMQYIDARGDAYEDALVEIVGILRATPSIAVPSDLLAIPPTVLPEEIDFEPRNPYKGLRPFSEQDIADFFGRQRLVDSLVEALHQAHLETTDAARLLVVVGPSGSGKSSVVMAGLIPRLQRGAVPDSSAWVYLNSMVPGYHPLETLSVTLADHLPETSLKAIREDLDDSSRGLHLLASRLVWQPDMRVLLLIDQFEELFTQVADEDERRSFINLLVTAVTEPHGPVSVILTLRADFYDRPMNYPTLGRLIEARSRLVLPMSLAELREAIEKPAAQDDVQLVFDDGLVGDLLFEVRGEAAALPLLQFTLDQLFRRRDRHRLTTEAYLEIGGVKGALANHAEDTYGHLPSEEHRELAHALFLRLIEPGTTEQDTTRRRAALTELILPDAKQTQVIQEVANIFTNARLLVTNKINETTTIEVSHEALIREWVRLADWLRLARDDIRLQKALSADATEWIQAQRSTDWLYRGSVLTDAQAWLARNVPSADEVAFIEASLAHQKSLKEAEIQRKQHEEIIARRAQNYGRATIALLVVGALALLATIFAGVLAANARSEVLRANIVLATLRPQVAAAPQTLAPIPQTIEPLQTTQTAVHSEQFAVQSTQTAVESRVEPLRLVDSANSILQTSDGNARVAALLSIRALKARYSPGAVTALTRAVERLNIEQAFIGHAGSIKSVAFSPSGQHVLTGSKDGTAHLWDRQTGAERMTLAGDVSKVAFSPDGKSILSGGDGIAQLWDIQTGKEIRQFVDEKTAAPGSALFLMTDERLYTANNRGGSSLNAAVAFSPDGRMVVTVSRNSAILWETLTGTKVRVLNGHTDQVTDVTFSPDGKYVLTGSIDNAVLLWDAQAGTEVRGFVGHRDSVNAVAFSPDGKYVLTGSNDTTVRLWDSQSGKEVRSFVGHRNSVNAVAFSPDGKYVLTGSDDTTMRLWDSQSGKEVRSFVGHGDYINAVAFSPDGKYVLTGSNDAMALLWKIDAPNKFTLAEHPDAVTYVAFSSDNTLMLTLSDDNTVHLWNRQTNAELYRIANVTCAAFLPDGKSIVTGSNARPGDGRTIQIWDARTGVELRGFDSIKDGVTTVVTSPDGKAVLAGGVDGTMVLLDVLTGATIQHFSGAGRVTRLSYSPDGKLALTSGVYTTAQVWDVQTGTRVQSLARDIGSMTSAVFSPDGKFILSGGADGTVRLWDAQSRTELRGFVGHTGAVTSVAFSPDGKFILTGSTDTTARLWDLRTGTEQGQITLHTRDVFSVAFSPDGKDILTGSADKIARLQFSDYRGLLNFACTRLFGTLNLADLRFDERQAYGINDEMPTCLQAGSAITSPVPTTTPFSTAAPSLTAFRDLLPEQQTATLIANNNATALFELEQTQTKAVQSSPSRTPMLSITP